MTFSTSLWKKHRTGRALGLFVVISDFSVELANFCLEKTLRCGQELSWLNLQKRENKRYKLVSL